MLLCFVPTSIGPIQRRGCIGDESKYVARFRYTSVLTIARTAKRIRNYRAIEEAISGDFQVRQKSDPDVGPVVMKSSSDEEQR